MNINIEQRKAARKLDLIQHVMHMIHVSISEFNLLLNNAKN